MNIKTAMGVAWVLGLVGCASLGSSQQQPFYADQWQAQRDWAAFQTQGRLAVKVSDKGSYANFDWSREEGVETLEVKTPLGNTVGQICQDSLGALAVDNHGKTYRAPSAQALSQQLLGYDLPLAHFWVWVSGEWLRDQPHTVDEQGRLHQLGWRIGRELDKQGLPRVVVLEKDTLSVRVALTDVVRTLGTPSRQGRCAARLED